MKREVQPAATPQHYAGRRWLAVAAVLAGVVGALLAWLRPWRPVTAPAPAPQAIEQPAEGRAVKALRVVSRADLEALRWDDVNPLLGAVSADPAEVRRLILLAAEVGTPVATYFGALLLIADQRPAEALTAFEALDPTLLPPTFLYAPFRLQEELRPDGPQTYLVALRKAVAEGKVPALIRARVQARDGDLAAALASYLRTDPRAWARYDLEALGRIAAHQGLAPDVRKLVGGALASGRVEAELVPALTRLSHHEPAAAAVEALKRDLRREIAEQTPAGKLAIESAKRLLNDRRLFLAKDYTGLLSAHRKANALDLPTETVLLLFLSAVELRSPIEMDQWGEELKRRHPDATVRSWVSETKASAR